MPTNTLKLTHGSAVLNYYHVERIAPNPNMHYTETTTYVPIHHESAQLRNLYHIKRWPQASIVSLRAMVMLTAITLPESMVFHTKAIEKVLIGLVAAFKKFPDMMTNERLHDIMANICLIHSPCAQVSEQLTVFACVIRHSTSSANELRSALAMVKSSPYPALKALRLVGQELLTHAVAKVNLHDVHLFTATRMTRIQDDLASLASSDISTPPEVMLCKCADIMRTLADVVMSSFDSRGPEMAMICMGHAMSAISRFRATIDQRVPTT